MSDQQPNTATRAYNLAVLDSFAGYAVALVADALDSLGRYEQVMSCGLSQLSGSGTMAGYAVTVAVGGTHRGVEQPYAKEFEAIELLRAGTVLVASTVGPPAAFWGELLTQRARKLNARGAIIDGYARDLKRIRAHNFPVWARGANACDSAGRLEAYAVGQPVMCAGVLVRMGDLIVTDCDGVVVVPQELIGETLRRVVEKDKAESAVREALANGSTTHEVYEKYKVL